MTNLKKFDDLKAELDAVGPLEAIYALEDGEYLSRFDVTQDQVEMLYDNYGSYTQKRGA
tara:strand:+ start:1054 stop:1230 length:177 start_codon:yes stop_codon:yes gene_type:complete